MGVPFLERGTHGARLTREGLLFLESDRRFDIERATLIGAASELGARRARSLRVGLTHAASDGPAVQALARMMRSRSGLRAAGSAQLAIGDDITVVGLHARSARLAVVRPHNGEVQTLDPPSADEPIDLGRLFVELGFAGLQNVREEPVGFSPGTQDLVVYRIAQHVLDGG